MRHRPKVNQSLTRIIPATIRLALSGMLLASGLGLAWQQHQKAPQIGAKDDVSVIEFKDPKVLALTSLLPEAKIVPESHAMVADGELVPVITRVPTDQPVVFLTIDDGVFRDQPGAAFIKDNHLPTSLFLNNYVVSKDYGYFKDLVQNGSRVENHTYNHPHLTKLKLEEQKSEICANADAFEKAFGERPKLFRPPYGQYNEQTRKAAKECGSQALVMWSAYIEKGAIHFQNNATALRAGDIVLIHFKPEMVEDLKAFMAEATKANLSIGLLEDWLK